MQKPQMRPLKYTCRWNAPVICKTVHIILVAPIPFKPLRKQICIEMKSLYLSRGCPVTVQS